MALSCLAFNYELYCTRSAVHKVAEVRHFMQHSGGHLADGAVNVLGANVDLAVCLAACLPDFVYAAQP